MTCLIEMYGDSTTFGATVNSSGVWSQSTMNPPATVNSLYTSQVSVTNKGVSGITTENLLSGTGSVTTPWTTVMANSPSKIVTIDLGINDAFQGVSDSDFTTRLTSLVTIAKYYGKTVILVTPSPVNTPYYQRTSDLAQCVRNVAAVQGVALVDLFAFIQTLSGWTTHLTDGTHPDAYLYWQIGNAIYQTIKTKLFQQLAM